MAKLSKKSSYLKTVSEDQSPADVGPQQKGNRSTSPTKRQQFRRKPHKRNTSEQIPIAKPPLSPSEIILGKCIGRGKLGRIMRAELGSLTFAVKLVEKSALRYAEAERDALSNLIHARIVNFHNYTEDAEQAYIVLELVPGEDLFHFMRRKRLTRAEVGMVGAQVLMALEYIHSNGYIYRDLKPENIMVLPSGDIKLIDFGFAKLMSTERTFTTLGSPEYMAPEVILKEGHNKGADWWSFGVLLYEMLCGQAPFRGDTVEETYEEIVRGDLEFARNIEPSAKDIIRRLLTRDPENRLGTAGTQDLKRHKFFANVDWTLTS